MAGERERERADEKQRGKAAGEGGMSVSEAGRLGGETVREKYGPGFYSEIGRKGGEHSHRGEAEKTEKQEKQREGKQGGDSSRRPREEE